MKSIPINIVCEDELSEIVLKKILNSFGEKFSFQNTYRNAGFGYIKKNLSKFNNASIHTPYLVLTDLDNAKCPVALIAQWVDFQQHRNLIFRIAVREVEAWLMADIEGFAGFLGISEANFQTNPDELPDPKNELFRLTKKSRKREIREDILPMNGNAAIGPNYNGKLSDFVINHWSINRSIKRSISLLKTLNALEKYKTEN